MNIELYDIQFILALVQAFAWVTLLALMLYVAIKKLKTKNRLNNILVFLFSIWALSYLCVSCLTAYTYLDSRDSLKRSLISLEETVDICPADSNCTFQ